MESFITNGILGNVKPESNKEAEKDGILSGTFKYESPLNANEKNSKKPKDETITILLFGRVGGGRTTLANVINNTNNVEESTCKYKIIDTIGIGDKRLTPQEILYNFAETADDIKGGFNQILFVTNGRFREEEINAYDLLQTVIFDQDIVNFTTIVRTNFPDFEDEDVCDKDRSNMINENNKLSTVIKGCKKVIHVDNPPITHRTKQIAEEIREESKKKLLNYLNNCRKVYDPPNLDELNSRIRGYITDIEKLEIEIKRLEKRVKAVRNSEINWSHCNIL
ncbi:54_t:CDS:1 [Entrophospora sp. SA101]|nr:54_t:CDS:1 [Entrophospora sp. SA101]CAJ0905113.1 3128_t:CDS:1 [Entrophospora sp. SA101]